MDYVDPKRYVGKWYEQVLIPNWFETNCADTFAEYKIIDDKTLSVVNTCTRNGKTSGKEGKGYILDETNSKLKVVFDPIFNQGGQYWIVKLGDSYDYGYSVVSSPDYKYLWILSRQ